MKMTHKEMKSVVTHDVLKYLGPSNVALIKNKLYTVKSTDDLHVHFHMPKGQSLSIAKVDHDLWEMHEARGAEIARKRYLEGLVAAFNSHVSYIEDAVNELNLNAGDIEVLMKDFPLDSKMKLLGSLSKEKLEVLDFLHKIHKHRLTVSKLLKVFKGGKYGSAD